MSLYVLSEVHFLAFTIQGSDVPVFRVSIRSHGVAEPHCISLAGENKGE